MQLAASLELSKLSSDNDVEFLSEWRWLVPADYVSLYATAFGDLFLRAPDGTIFYLNTLDAVLVNAANDETHLLEQLRNKSLRAEVLLPELACKLTAKFATLGENECFSIIIPPTLGGALDPANFHILPLKAHLAALGKIQGQVATDPPGTTYDVITNG